MPEQKPFFTYRDMSGCKAKPFPLVLVHTTPGHSSAWAWIGAWDKVSMKHRADSRHVWLLGFAELCL